MFTVSKGDCVELIKKQVQAWLKSEYGGGLSAKKVGVLIIAMGYRVNNCRTIFLCYF
jgi:hypothetical protein